MESGQVHKFPTKYATEERNGSGVAILRLSLILGRFSGGVEGSADHFGADAPAGTSRSLYCSVRFPKNFRKTKRRSIHSLISETPGNRQTQGTARGLRISVEHLAMINGGPTERVLRKVNSKLAGGLPIHGRVREILGSWLDCKATQ